MLFLSFSFGLFLFLFQYTELVTFLFSITLFKVMNFSISVAMSELCKIIYSLFLIGRCMSLQTNEIFQGEKKIMMSNKKQAKKKKFHISLLPYTSLLFLSQSKFGKRSFILLFPFADLNIPKSGSKSYYSIPRHFDQHSLLDLIHYPSFSSYSN